MEIRPATKNKLGAVIVGDGFNITEEGMLTIDENLIMCDEYVEFTRERLNEIFEQLKRGDGEQ